MRHRTNQDNFTIETGDNNCSHNNAKVFALQWFSRFADFVISMEIRWKPIIMPMGILYPFGRIITKKGIYHYEKSRYILQSHSPTG